MGIPKFYRWLSERYPLLNQKVTATEGPPEVDNLYLDMNGIIHNCTHANQKEVKLSEEDMMLRTFDYIDKLVQIIKPQKLLLMAIDGCAPRAKMNQQRSRRFKAAKEREETMAEMRRKGEQVPENPFDSNCITPGTPFMDRLGKHLRFFIRRKKSTDPLWQKPAVIFSGHDVPGEGEHKIMEYIRWEKRSPDYTPNQRHCMYGLDADLVMLSLVTHEPHFFLLREVVSYTGGNRGQPTREVLENPCAENFILFHISLLREYLELEFSGIPTPFPLDAERVVDDFVLFCMLVGNDFLPALPTLDINEGALNAIMTLYKELLPTMGGYLTHAGELDRGRLEKLLAKLGEMELNVLEERAKDAEYMEGKRNKKRGMGGGEASTGIPYAPSTGSGLGLNGRGTHSRHASGPPADANGGGSAGFKLLRRPASGASVGNGSFAALASASDTEGNGQPDGDSATEPEEAGGGDTSAGEGESAVSGAGVVRVRKGRAAQLAAGDGRGPGAISPLLGPLEEEEDEAAPAVPQEPTMMSKEARQLMLSGLGAQGLELWKDRWYREKLGVPPSGRRQVVEAYIQGLHWVLEYYYRGVASWNWYYPHHYAPMASDLVDLDTINVTFTQGTPFKPYEQLLAVLPSASCALLPGPFQPLMLDPHSPVIDFYPTEFEVDMEGKRASWEGVVKVPFVDEARLLAASRSIPPGSLTADERARNELGSILVFTHDSSSKEVEHCTSTMPKVFSDVLRPMSKLVSRPMPPPLPVADRGFVPTLVPGTSIGLHAPRGYPTLKSMQVRAELRMAGVNVLGTPSRKESLLLIIKDLRAALNGQIIPVAQVAPTLLNARCYVNWPYLQEARIVRVSDSKEQWYTTGHAEPQVKAWQSQEASKWQQEAGAIASALLVKHGLDVGKCDLVCGVKVCKGFVRHMDGSIQKIYSEDEVKFPLQCIIRQRPQGPPGSSGAAAAGEEDLPPPVELKEGDHAVFLGKSHYGCIATILPDVGTGLTRTGKVAKNKGVASYRVSVTPLGPPSDPDPMARVARRIITQFEPKYMHSGEVARKIGVAPRLLGRMTGNVWVSEGEERYDVGLAVKASGKNACLPGYVRQTDDGGGWMYSAAMANILLGYKTQVPWVWEAVDRSLNSESSGGGLRLADMLPDVPTPEGRKAKVAAAVKWIKACPLASRPLVPSHVQLVTDEGIRALQQAMPPLAPQPAVEYESVPPALLLPPFTPGPEQVKMSVQGGEFALGDRVVSVLRAGVPGFGVRGTVIGVYDEALEVLFDTEFPGGTNLGGKVNGKNGAVVPHDILLNVSRPATLPLNKSSAPKAKGGQPAGAAGAAHHAVATALVSVKAGGAHASAATAAAVAAVQGSSGAKTVAVAKSTRPASGAAAAGAGRSHQGRPQSAHPVGAAAATSAVPASPPPPRPSAGLLARASGVSSSAASSSEGLSPATSGTGAVQSPALPPEGVGRALLNQLHTNAAVKHAKQQQQAAAGKALLSQLQDGAAAKQRQQQHGGSTAGAAAGPVGAAVSPTAGPAAAAAAAPPHVVPPVPHPHPHHPPHVHPPHLPPPPHHGHMMPMPRPPVGMPPPPPYGMPPPPMFGPPPPHMHHLPVHPGAVPMPMAVPGLLHNMPPPPMMAAGMPMPGLLPGMPGMGMVPMHGMPPPPPPAGMFVGGPRGPVMPYGGRGRGFGHTEGGRDGRGRGQGRGGAGSHPPAPASASTTAAAGAPVRGERTASGMLVPSHVIAAKKSPGASGGAAGSPRAAAPHEGGHGGEEAAVISVAANENSSNSHQPAQEAEVQA